MGDPRTHNIGESCTQKPAYISLAQIELKKEEPDVDWIEEHPG